MTKNDCMVKIEEMLSDVLDYVRAEARRLAGCGALDFEKESRDSNRTPKAVLTVALENAANQYSPFPFDKAGRKDIRNLRRF
jgi:hypothetical protein